MTENRNIKKAAMLKETLLIQIVQNLTYLQVPQSVVNSMDLLPGITLCHIDIVLWSVRYRVQVRQMKQLIPSVQRNNMEYWHAKPLMPKEQTFPKQNTGWIKIGGP